MQSFGGTGRVTQEADTVMAIQRRKNPDNTYSKYLYVSFSSFYNLEFFQKPLCSIRTVKLAVCAIAKCYQHYQCTANSKIQSQSSNFGLPELRLIFEFYVFFLNL